MSTLPAATPAPVGGRWPSLGVPLLIIAVAIAGPALVAVVTTAGIADGWYGSLNKPAWNPPNWVFGPVWTALYAMMAVAACLVWAKRGSVPVAWPMTAYTVQFTLNLLWSVLFFGLKQPAIAFAELLALVVAVTGTAVLFFRVNRWAGWLLVPYLGWVCFAAVLNGTIVALNW